MLIFLLAHTRRFFGGRTGIRLYSGRQGILVLKNLMGFIGVLTVCVAK